MDGKDLKACIIPEFGNLESGKIYFKTKEGAIGKRVLSGKKWHSCKVQCYSCEQLYNTPLCVDCSRLGEPYSAFKYCYYCSFKKEQEKSFSRNSVNNKEQKLDREKFVQTSRLFKPDYIYTGKYVNNACGICFDGMNRNAYTLREYYNGKHFTCLFCDVST